MYLSRFILSAIVLIITNLIVGSISLSLGLMVTVGLAAVAVVSVALLTLLGFAVAMERMNWVRRGWTDAKIDRVKAWLNTTREAMPDWYARQRTRILDLLIEALKQRETRPPDSARLATMKFIVVGLLALLSVTLLRHSAGLSVGWALALTAFGALIVSVPIMRFRSNRLHTETDRPRRTGESPEVRGPREALVGQGDLNENAEAWQTILALHRSGKLRRLLEEPPDLSVEMRPFRNEPEAPSSGPRPSPNSLRAVDR
jgi:protein-S-isoprenylcysteine O-methyltransferase Ste14